MSTAFLPIIWKTANQQKKDLEGSAEGKTHDLIFGLHTLNLDDRSIAALDHMNFVLVIAVHVPVDSLSEGAEKLTKISLPCVNGGVSCRALMTMTTIDHRHQILEREIDVNRLTCFSHNNNAQRIMSQEQNMARINE
jgi:hypothetical protein